MSMRSFSFVFAGAWLALAGCSADAEPTPFDDGGRGGSTASAGASGPAGPSGTGASGGIGIGGFGSGGSGSGGEDVVAEVFGHSSSVLYRLDPTTKEVTVVGPFSGCSDVIDIAADKDGQLYGTTFGGLYRIDKLTAACTFVAAGSYPNSLSFVPAGTVDPNVEALVGYDGSQYVRIDPQTGAITTIGAIGGGYVSSGDIVSVKNGKTLLTVLSLNCTDCIVEVDPKTGALVKDWGALPYGSVFGLAFWAGSAYGFSDYGDLFEVTFGNDAITVTPIAIPNPPPGLSFWGAGSTTSAPPIPDPE